MKTTQYVRQEKAIAAADSGGIRERWLWGLRLLNDAEKIAAAGGLRHGVAEELIAAAGKTPKGRNRLGAQEIQRRLRCARAYRTEAEIREALTEFGSWDDLCRAGFPPYEVPEGEPLADYRTDDERRREWNRVLAEAGNEQLALFPVDRFELTTSTIKELVAYTDEMAELTARFAARDHDRRMYVEQLVAASGGDLSTIWQVAHERAYGDEPVPHLRVMAA